MVTLYPGGYQLSDIYPKARLASKMAETLDKNVNRFVSFSCCKKVGVLTKAVVFSNILLSKLKNCKVMFCIPEVLDRESRCC